MLTNTSGSLSSLLPSWWIHCSLSLPSSLTLQLPIGPMRRLGFSPRMLLDLWKHGLRVPVTLWRALVAPALFAFPTAAQWDWLELCPLGSTKLSSLKKGINPEHQGEEYIEFLCFYNSRERGHPLVLRAELALTSQRCLSKVDIRYIFFHNQSH